MEVPPSFVRQPQSSKTGNTACHHKSQRPPHGVEHTRPRDITKQERIEAIAKFSEAHETYEHAKSSITTWKERGSIRSRSADPPRGTPQALLSLCANAANTIFCRSDLLRTQESTHVSSGWTRGSKGPTEKKLEVIRIEA